MKTKIVFLLLPGCLLALALTGWLVHVPTPAQADEIPEKYRETVAKGLEYLAKNQHKDGHWEGDGGKHPVAMTGLAGLALFMETSPPRRRGSEERICGSKYSDNIHKAADWLMDQSQPKRDGLIFSEHASETARYMQGHGLATIFLVGVCEMEANDARRKKLTAVLTGAVKYIVRAQSTQGGWYHTSKVEGHDFDAISATVIQIQALQAAENAGIPVPREAITDAQRYLRTAIGDPGESGGKPLQNHNQPTDSAGALACRCNSPDEVDKLGRRWLEHLKTGIPLGRDTKFGRDELTHYYYAQAVSNLGGETWTAYRTAMFDHLKASQNKDGSWPASDGLGVGPVYATALWCTVLQLDKRSHPSSQQIQETVK